MKIYSKTLTMNAIRLNVNGLNATTAAVFRAKQAADLPNAYLTYSGSGTTSPQNDYAPIDGPNRWIEYSSQGGIIVRNALHPHSVWRDRTSDYGGN